MKSSEDRYMSQKWGPPNSDFVEEAKRILKAADERGVTLRLMGALASRMHCQEYAYIQKVLGRPFSDIDFASYSQFRGGIEELFRELGYVYDEMAAKVFMAEFGYVGRLTYEDQINKRHIDVFFDKLEFSHDIPLKGRLEVDSPTIPLAELLLTKMQIVKLNEKDIIDTVMLLREHEVGETDKETINARHIAKLCAADWGLWKTVTTNLKTTMELLLTFAKLNDDDKIDVNMKIQRVLNYINEEPKPLSWKMRAKIGEKIKWYRDVEAITR